MRRMSLVLALVLVLVGCSDPSGVGMPDLTGRWSGSTETGDVPATLQITVLERDGQLTGAGVIFVVQAVHSLTLEGVHAYPNVSFKNAASGFADFNYSGRFDGNATIVGTLRGSGFGGQTVILTRDD